MILLQPHTKLLLDNCLASTAHGILLSGPVGAGKTYVARYFAAKKLGVDPEQLASYPYFSMISPQNGSITIDQIRDLQRFLQLKTPGQAAIRRGVIIEDAHLMNTEAQNALLKSLEEPPADTVLILTAPATLRLKATIYSRVQQIPVLPLAKSEAVTYFESQFELAAIEKAFRISGGYMGLMSALLHAGSHALLDEISRAKHLFGSNTYERLLQVDELSKQKDTLPLFLQACKLICSAALHQAAQKSNAKQLQRWHRTLESVYQAEAALPHNPNAKLLLDNLLLSL